VLTVASLVNADPLSLEQSDLGFRHVLRRREPEIATRSPAVATEAALVGQVDVPVIGIQILPAQRPPETQDEGRRGHLAAWAR
jgi:hypothetical protein